MKLSKLWIIPAILAVIMCGIEISRDRTMFVDEAFSILQSQEPMTQWFAHLPLFYLLATILLFCVPFIIHDKDGKHKHFLIFFYSALGIASLSVAGLAPSDVHPPLSYIILKVWLLVFPVSATFARLLSTVMLVFIIWAIWRYCERFHSKTVAFLATSIIALSATWTHYGTDVRMYPFVVFFSVLAFHQFRVNLDKPTELGTYIYAIYLVILVNLHYLSASLLILFHSIIHLKRKGFNKTLSQYSPVFFGSIPAIFYFLMQNARVVKMYLAQPTVLSWISSISFSINYPDTLSGGTNSPLLLVFALFMFFIMLWVVVKKLDDWTTNEFMIVIVPPICVIVLGYLWNIYHPRYELWALWLVPVLLAEGIVLTLKTVKMKNPLTLFRFILVVVIISCGVIIPLFYYMPSHEVQDASKKLEELNATLVLHETPFSMLPMKLYVPKMRHIWLTNFTKLERNSMTGDVINESDLITNWTNLPSSFYYVEHWHYLNTSRMTLEADYDGIRVWSSS